MATLRQVFDTSITMIQTLWTNLLSNWSVFGIFIIAMPLLRKVAQAFNKLKS